MCDAFVSFVCHCPAALLAPDAPPPGKPPPIVLPPMP
jgi:hypothetical protein